MNDTHTTNAVISCFAMALRGQSLDEYNAEDTHTRRTAEKRIETALQVTGFVLGAPLVPNSDSCSGVVGPWPTLSAVHPSVSIVSDREGDRWRRDGSTSRFGDDWLLFDKKIGAWRPWEISLDRAALFAPFSELEKATKPEYPHPGLAGLTVLGPEIFTDGEVINWRGENFVRQQDPEAFPSVTPIEDATNVDATDDAHVIADAHEALGKADLNHVQRNDAINQLHNAGLLIRRRTSLPVAKEDTKAERRDPDELAKRMARIWDGGWDEFDEEEREYLRRAAEIARSYFGPFTAAKAEQ